MRNESSDRTILPMVTIGTPVYNSAWSLPRVLDAILKLDYPRNLLRIVFVNNGSTDNSEELLLGFKSTHRSEYEGIIIRESSLPSIPVARNICLDSSEGTDFIFFIDADVVVPSQTLQKLIGDFSKGKNVGMTSVPCDYENSERRAGLLYRAFVRPSGCVEASKVGAGCTLISSKTVRSVGKFNEKLKVHEDAEYCFRINREGFIIICDLSFRAYHLRQIKADAAYYLKFMRQSSITYLQMLKLHSGLHYAKVASSLCVTVSLFLLAFLPLMYVFETGFLAVSLAFAFWSNLNRRAMDDGSSVKKAYWPIMGVILTSLVVTIVWISIFRLLLGSLPRTGQESKPRILKADSG